MAVAVLALGGWALVNRPETAEPEPTIPAPTPTTIPTTRPRVPIPVEEWWAQQLIEGESPGVVAQLAEGVVVLLTSFDEPGDTRAPIVRRIDPVRERIFWAATGRDGADWRRGDPIVADGILVISDAVDNPTSFETGAGGNLLGFDAATGEVAWATEFDVGFEQGTRSLSKLIFDGRFVLFAQTLDRRLARIDPRTGTIDWQTSMAWGPIVGTQSGGELGPLLEVVAPEGRALLDPLTGDVVDLLPARSIPVPPEGLLDELTAGAESLDTRNLGDQTELVSWSFPVGLSRRAPGIARVADDSDVIWANEGRPGTTWQGPEHSARIDDVLVRADVVDGETHGSLVAFDIETGNRLWISQFRVPIASAEYPEGGATVSMRLRSGGSVLMTRTVGLGLVRVSPLTGSPVWSAEVPPGRVAGSVRRSDGTEVVALVTDKANLFLDVESGDLVPL